MRTTVRCLLVSFALLAACGASTAPADPPPSSDPRPPPDSPPPADDTVCNGHRATDSCMNAENFAVCQEMSRRCPGQVLDLESCPLQFACP